MAKLKGSAFISLLALLPSFAVGDLSGYVYADNYFELFYNGQFVVNDPVSFIPHNAVFFNLTETEEPACRTFAILAKDYADEQTGLEYNNTCVGDGGLRLVLSDGTVSGSFWKRFTFFYGPINLEECLPGVDLNDGMRNCDNENGMNLEAPCVCQSSTIPEGWYLPGFDDSEWEQVTLYTDEEVGWGRAPDPDSGLLNPRDVDWQDSVFMWASDLDLHNRVLFRYSTCD